MTKRKSSRAKRASRRRSRPRPRIATGFALLLAAPATLLAQQDDPQQGPLGQQGVDAYLAEDAIQVLYRRSMDLGELGTNAVRAGVFMNEGRDLIGIADVLIDLRKTPLPDRRWFLQVGPRAYGALLSIENEDIFSVAVGGTVGYYMGPRRRTSLSATAYYAPDITSFGNANSVTDLGIEFETPLTEATKVFVGYRWFRFDLAPKQGVNASDRDVDEGVHVGIAYRF